MGGGNAPEQDPNMGRAAMLSAKTGSGMLSFMKDQAKVTNAWGMQDRARDVNVFRPLQDRYIKDAQAWNSPRRQEAAVGRARADVSLAARVAQGTQQRQAMAMGVNPAAGAFQAAAAKNGMQTALAQAGAANLARRQTTAEGDARMANAINMGSGLAVNPGSAIGLSNGAMQAGGAAAMSGYGQQSQILDQDYRNRYAAWQQGQQNMAGLFGAVGTIAGAHGPAIMGMLSSKEAKTDKRRVPDGAALEAVRKMPVEAWTYKPGMGDGGRHIGTYAEDFTKATGQGDGRTIDVASALGVVMGAVKDLDRKVGARS